MDEETECLTCLGSGVCGICRGGSTHDVGFTCPCEATHRCIDCHGEGTYTAYAAEQMRRLRVYLRNHRYIT